MWVNYVDLFLFVALALASIRGFQRGFFRFTLSTFGFLFGFWAVTYVIPLLRTWHSPWQIPVLAMLFFLSSSLGSMVGILSGEFLARLAQRIRLGWLDRLVGGICASGAILMGLWLSSSLLFTIPNSTFQDQLATSQLVKWMETTFPPATGVSDRFAELIRLTNIIPTVVETSPAPTTPISAPEDASVQALFNRDKASMVKVEAYGCGGISFGSGFLVSADTVVTNAHVVAGTRRIRLQGSDENRPATLVAFNPNLDLAILKVTGLAQPSLTFAASDATRGTTGAVLGYPGGNDLTGIAAVVQDTITAEGQDIYGRKPTERQVYVVQANVQHGNSGGPLVEQDGLVAGVIFGGSTTQTGIGYALTASEVKAYVATEGAQSDGVSSGSCLSQ